MSAPAPAPAEALASVRAVLGALRPAARVVAVEPLGSGHIHDTYRVRCDGAAAPDEAELVAQRINRYVFRDPEALARNLVAVTGALREALRRRGAGPGELARRCLRPLADADARTLVPDASGALWRAFPFIPGTHSERALTAPERAEAAARAFGAFLADLAPLDPAHLAETIPAFHDLEARLASLEEAAARDPLGRAAGARDERTAARVFAARLAAEPGLAPGALPRRVVHNDCKLDNLLFDDASGEAVCVVDLDTVMGGSVVFDFGELARTAAFPAAEDERDPARIALDPALFAALARGYAAGAGDLLEPAERRALALAGPRMALENAVRFLADHFDGDRYFRAARPGQNLDRARSQLRRVECFLADESELRAVVAGL